VQPSEKEGAANNGDRERQNPSRYAASLQKRNALNKKQA